MNVIDLAFSTLGRSTPTFYISICISTLPTQHTTFISICPEGLFSRLLCRRTRRVLNCFIRTEEGNTLTLFILDNPISHI